MGFDVAASAYDRFMGRYSEPLAARFIEVVDPRSGDIVLDVGCGPGALLGRLAERLGPAGVVGIDPSASFVAAARARWPETVVQQAVAESLPFPDATFDQCLAQLVVHFMADPVAGLAEMARVTKVGGTVAACVWDFAGGRSPLSTFWRAARELNPDAPDESGLPGARAGQLPDLFAQAGLTDIHSSQLSIDVDCRSFDDWWDPFTLGVGPAGAYLDHLDPGQVDSLRSLCRARFPTGAFTVSATAWVAVGSAPARRRKAQ